jgi:UDP-2-acetamido-2-deoxy-ribo-hexuluronate aminotransferase
MLVNGKYKDGLIRLAAGIEVNAGEFPVKVLIPDSLMDLPSPGDAGTPIDFIDLKAQQQVILPALLENIFRVLSHGQYIMGPEVSELEARLADYTGAGHAISCASGTDALLMALMALGVGPGDAVFTTPFTFIATAEVIQLLGATPVFADIDPRTFNIDPGALEGAITGLPRNPRTTSLKPRGVIPVDLFGQPADYDVIKEIAGKHGLFVLGDAAQSFGATYKGKRAGALAPVTATSFFPAKPLGGYGDGGAIFTADEEMAAVLRSIRNHGQGIHRYENIRVGINGRLDTLQAAVLLAKLQIFDREVEARQKVARRYNEALAPVVEVPFVRQECTSVYAQYSVLSGNREAIQQRLTDANIPTAVYYPLPLHLQGAFAGLGYKPGDFPVSEWASKRIFSLPMHPYLDEGLQGKIIAAILS